jgi:hypothetical protein
MPVFRGWLRGVPTASTSSAHPLATFTDCITLFTNPGSDA